MGFLKNKKAQISSQVFIYVLAVVMIGLLLFIGVKAISTLITKFQNVNTESFKSGFQSDVETVARQYGSVKKVELDLAGKYDQICFVDAMDENNMFNFDVSVVENALIKSSVISGAKENVFLMKKGVWDDKFTAEKLDVELDYLCLENEGKLEVWLKGTGKTTLLYIQNE